MGGTTKLAAVKKTIILISDGEETSGMSYCTLPEVAAYGDTEGN